MNAFASAAGVERKWLVLSAMCLGLGMLMIDMFVVNVALPTIGQDFTAGLGRVQWIVSGYVLVIGVMPVAMGRLGDVLGRRRVYLAGLIVFIAASVACGLAPSIELLIAFRVLQGAGAATMMPGTLSIVTQAFPPSQRGLAIGIWGGVSGLGLIAGPLLGGLLVELGEWRLIFLINLPLGLVAIAMTLLFARESRDETATRRVDWGGLLALSGGLFALLFAVTRGSEVGWASSQTVGAAAAGAALLAAFVVIERRVRAPLVELSLFRNRTFVAACLSAFLFSATVFGAQPFLSLFMQNYWGFSPLEGGLAFLPSTVLVAALLPVSGMLGQRLGSRIRVLLVVAAGAVLASALHLLALTTASGYVDGFLPAFVARGLGVGLFMAASSFAVMSALPMARSGLASGTLTMARQVGTAVGVTVLGALYVRHIDGAVPVQLAASSSADVAAVLDAAHHFVNAAPAAASAAVSQAIVDGFILIALATSVMAAVAAVASLFIVPRDAERAAPASAAAAAATPAAAAPQLVLTAADGGEGAA
ncbi:MAG: DHA2 family efflux MFS transporter permease subunit [Dehalococcoidia bacterium]